MPLGYYKDQEKSAHDLHRASTATRYSVPGDFARIEDDNKVTLLGRGSNCINTGGEKVYPEEVEMALKAHPDVYDVLVVGIPDEKLRPGGHRRRPAARGRRRPTSRTCAASCASRLSGYKLPRSVTFVDEIPRNATGKANYPKAKELAPRRDRGRGPMRTPLCDVFGIDHPIFAFTPSEHVAAAVSRAGGLGVLGGVRFNDPDELDQTLTWLDDNTDGKPYGVDVVMPMKMPTEGDVGRPRGDDPARAQDVRRRDPAQARRAAAARGRGPGGCARLAALGGPLPRRHRAARTGRC